MASLGSWNRTPCGQPLPGSAAGAQVGALSGWAGGWRVRGRVCSRWVGGCMSSWLGSDRTGDGQTAHPAARQWRSPMPRASLLPPAGSVPQAPRVTSSGAGQRGCRRFLARALRRSRQERVCLPRGPGPRGGGQEGRRAVPAGIPEANREAGLGRANSSSRPLGHPRPPPAVPGPPVLPAASPRATHPAVRDLARSTPVTSLSCPSPGGPPAASQTQWGKELDSGIHSVRI